VDTTNSNVIVWFVGEFNLATVIYAVDILISFENYKFWNYSSKRIGRVVLVGH